VISIVIPAHNGGEFLDSALASVRAQRVGDLEVLLVDDGSTDELRPPPWVRFIRQPHMGQSAARNRGVRESSGEFLAFLDIDDMWAPGHLSRLHAAFIANPAAGVAQGCMRQLCGERISGAYRMPYIGSFLFRRNVFNVCGGFDETMTLGEDHDLIYRCWEQDIVKVHIDEVSLIYRRHAGNISRGNNLRSHLLVLKRRIERIRSGLVDPALPRRFPFQEYIGHIQGASQWTIWSAS
jgi:glycosyltransferase involved in cell wall biosynthesis